MKINWGLLFTWSVSTAFCLGSWGAVLHVVGVL